VEAWGSDETGACFVEIAGAMGVAAAAGFGEGLGFALGAGLTEAAFGKGAFSAAEAESEAPFGAGTVEDFCAEAGS